MSRDDSFIARLKSLEGPTPQLPVDRERVLAAGRRRRGMRAATVTALSVFALAGVVTAAFAVAPATYNAGPPATTESSAPTTTPTATEPHVAPAHAVIDPATGLVSTPFSTFMVNQHDLDIMTTAWDLARSRCMADAGYADSFVFAVTHTALPESRPYGIWDRDELRQYGYAGPPADPYAGEGSKIRVSSPAVDAAMQTCADQVRPMGFMFEPTSFDDIAPAIGVTSAVDLPEGQAVVALWTACLAAHDVAAPDEKDSLEPAGVRTMSLADQIRIGLIDIDCKESTNLRQRLADIDAVQQQGYLDSAPQFVATYRATVALALATSQAYLAAAGIDMP